MPDAPAPIATTSLARDEDGRYTVTVALADGNVRQVCSSGWSSIASAYDFAARLIASELRVRKLTAELVRERIGDGEVP